MPTAFHRLAVVWTMAALVCAGASFAQTQSASAANDVSERGLFAAAFERNYIEPAAVASVKAPDSAPPCDERLANFDSSTGFIDSALPWTQLRVRYDSAYDFRRPTRAEFFFAKPRPTGPGLPFPETRVDYQEPSLYGEMCITDRWSILAEAPMRFLNPEINRNYYGISDITVGGKYAFIMEDYCVATLQLRVTSPTGDADRGLGTRHVSIEPGLLGWLKLNDRWGFESEVRYWAPVGGTDFAGDIMRYGFGIYHNLYLGDTLRIAPVAEFVGWSVFGGKERFIGPSGFDTTRNAAGDTIVNANLGVRVGFGSNNDMYIGYGHALTDQKWYRDALRLEMRRRF